jgi:hypothetical protein
LDHENTASWKTGKEREGFIIRFIMELLGRDGLLAQPQGVLLIKVNTGWPLFLSTIDL